MDPEVRIYGKTSLGGVLVWTVLYLVVLLVFGVGALAISLLTIAGVHDAIIDAPYWADLILALVIGAVGVGVTLTTWQIPFLFVREYAFDGKVLIYRTLWHRSFRSQFVANIYNVDTVDDRWGRPVFPRIEFVDGSRIGLGFALCRGSREAALLEAVVQAMRD